jgi:ABC-type cobalamin/Fe3+-siderophores transport system ATPase subunit
MSVGQIGIREISIKNFRGIDELNLSFVGPKREPTQIVVLAGPNGCGKTSVLEACLVALSHERLAKGKVGPSAVRLGEANYAISAIVQTESSVESVYVTSDRSAIESLPCAYFSSWRAPGLVGAVGITTGKKGKRPAKTESNRLWVVKQHLVNARAHELFPASGTNGATRYSETTNRLNGAWQQFYPGQTFAAEPISSEPDAGFDVFVSGGSQDRISVDDLSSGQLELFLFAGALLVDNWERGVLVIDEPELHLDPQWHRQVIKALVVLKPQCQLIVATHSPEIYHSVRSFERHFLLSEDDERAKAWQAATVAEVAS